MPQSPDLSHMPTSKPITDRRCEITTEGLNLPRTIPELEIDSSFSRERFWKKKKKSRVFPKKRSGHKARSQYHLPMKGCLQTAQLHYWLHFPCACKGKTVYYTIVIHTCVSLLFPLACRKIGANLTNLHIPHRAWHRAWLIESVQETFVHGNWIFILNLIGEVNSWPCSRQADNAFSHWSSNQINPENLPLPCKIAWNHTLT